MCLAQLKPSFRHSAIESQVFLVWIKRNLKKSFNNKYCVLSICYFENTCKLSYGLTITAAETSIV